MLRYLLDLSSDSTFTWRYEFGSSLAFHHELDAALLDLLLHFNMNLILRYLIFSSISTWTWCRATWAPRAIQHELDATLRDLLLRCFDMSLMLRYLIFSSFQHELDAALLEHRFQFNMNFLMLCCVTVCSSTWSWCYATWSFLAVHGELDATLLALLLRFDMNLMLRCLIFSCSSSWTWCYATWSSLPFHSLALCYLIVFCCQWIRCYATWSSLGCRKRSLAPKSESHPLSNPSWSWNVIGRWIWAKHVMASLVFFQSYQINLHCVVLLGNFFCQRARPPNLENDY